MDKNLNLPVVLKKLEGQGGSGIVIVWHEEEYNNILQDFEGAFAEKFIGRYRNIH